MTVLEAGDVEEFDGERRQTKSSLQYKRAWFTSREVVSVSDDFNYLMVYACDRALDVRADTTPGVLAAGC